jgi:thiamine-phosphate pyrophosphorylase
MVNPAFELPPVYPILDTASLERTGVSVVMAAEALLEGGARILQLRHKSLWSGGTVETARTIARMCGSAKAAFVVNDRADYAALIARELGGSCRVGLHVGQDDLAPEDARKVTGAGVFIGLSTHNADQVRAAESEPVDYIAFGPVFGTRSKERPDPEVGIAGLRAARALTSKPLVAIGGITRDNAWRCLTRADGLKTANGLNPADAEAAHAAADSVAVIADMIPLDCSREALRDRMIEWRRQTNH